MSGNSKNSHNGTANDFHNAAEFAQLHYTNIHLVMKMAKLCDVDA